MNIAAICCLVFFAATAYAENCHRTSDCKLVACNAGFSLSCYRDNVCTCYAHLSTYKCINGTQCEHAFNTCTHGDHRWHCVDNACHCRS